MPLKNSVFEAPKLVSTKTLLLKHYYCRQGLRVSLAAWGIIESKLLRFDGVDSKPTSRQQLGQLASNSVRGL